MSVFNKPGCAHKQPFSLVQSSNAHHSPTVVIGSAHNNNARLHATHHPSLMLHENWRCGINLLSFLGCNTLAVDEYRAGPSGRSGAGFGC